MMVAGTHRLRPLHASNRTGHHALAAPGAPDDLGQPEALSVELADSFALGLGDVQGVEGAAPVEGWRCTCARSNKSADHREP